MDYKDFTYHIRDSIQKMADKNETVCLNKVLKNNDMELDALCIHTKQSNISPSIYLNTYYTEYLEGRELADIIREIYQLFRTHKDQLQFNINRFRSFETIKDRLAFKLINRKSNKRLLQTVPFVEFLDLAIVFYFLIDDEYLGSATALIHNVHLDMWNITKDELYQHALENTTKILPPIIRNMNDIITDMLAKDIEETIYEKDYRYEENCRMPSPQVVAEGVMNNVIKREDLLEMYVLTNQQKLNGASCILYEHVLREFALSIERNLYILPSSIHEVILVPAYPDISKRQLSKMVQEVNIQELEMDDILSDHAYYYDYVTDKIMY